MITRHEQMRLQVIEFHKKNPIVWELFDKFTRDRIAKGFKHYGARAIMDRIRWETAHPEYGDNQFKINNNHSAFYGRAWNKANPAYGDFYRTRAQTSKHSDSTLLPELTPAYFEESVH